MGRVEDYSVADQAIIDPNRFKVTGDIIHSSDTPNVACPHCGKINSDLWEFDNGWSRFTECDFECQRCDKPLTLTIDRSVTYSLSKRTGSA